MVGNGIKGGIKLEESTKSALSHLTVIEIGGMAAAYSSGFLAGLGANVIKVEPPEGDPNRLLPPFAGDLSLIHI